MRTTPQYRAPPQRPQGVARRFVAGSLAVVLLTGAGTGVRAVAGFTFTDRWPARLDAAVRDRLPGRDLAKRSHARAMLALGTSPTPHVIVGATGTLFYTAPADHKFLPWHGPRFEAREAHCRATFAERRTWCEVRGIRYLAVIVPEKQLVVPDEFPAGLVPSRPPLAMLCGDVLDLTPALVAGRADGRTVLRTDTHWTPRGAHVGVQATLAALGLPPLPPPAFAAEPGVFAAGDLAAMIGLPGALPESFEQPTWPTPKPRPSSLPRSPSWLGHVQPALFEQPGYAGPRVVLFGDSYAVGVYGELLAKRAARLTLIPSYEFERELIELERPDIVIDEIAERSLLRAAFRP